MTERDFVLRLLSTNEGVLNYGVDTAKAMYKGICENTNDEKEEAEDFIGKSFTGNFHRIKLTDISSISSCFTIGSIASKEKTSAVDIYLRTEFEVTNMSICFHNEEKDRFLAWFEAQKRKIKKKS